MRRSGAAWLALTFLCCAAAALAQTPGAEAIEAYQAAMDRYWQAAARGQAPAARAAQADAQTALLEARTALEQAGAARPGSPPDSLLAYAQTLAWQGNYDLAAERLAAALRVQGNVPALQAALADYARWCGDDWQKRGLDAAQAVIDGEAEPDLRARALQARGDYLWRAGLYDLAGADYAAAAELVPENVENALRLAADEARRGDVVQASARLDELGQAAQRHDAETRARLREALHNFERRSLTFADDAAHHAAYGKLLYRAARLGEAALAVRRALELDPGRIDDWSFLGAVNSQLGNLDAALRAYEEALERAPEQPALRELVERLRRVQDEQRPQQPGATQSAPPQSGAAPPPLLQRP